MSPNYQHNLPNRKSCDIYSICSLDEVVIISIYLSFDENWGKHIYHNHTVQTRFDGITTMMVVIK